MSRIVFLSTRRDGKSRLVTFKDDPPLPDGALRDEAWFLEPDALLCGRPAKDWPDGRYRLVGGVLRSANPA